MEALVNYIKPELLITAVALYFMGIALKEAILAELGITRED